MNLLHNSYLDEIFKLRYITFLKVNAIDKDIFTERKVYDKFDWLPSTLHIAVFENLKIIGSARVVEYSDKGLSTDEIYPLSFYLEKMEKTFDCSFPIADLSRIVVHPNYQNKGLGTYIMHKIIEHSLYSLNIKTIITAGNPFFKSLFDVGFKKLDEPIDFMIGDSNQKKQKAIPMCITKDSFCSPKKLVNPNNKCKLFRPDT